MLESVQIFGITLNVDSLKRLNMEGGENLLDLTIAIKDQVACYTPLLVSDRTVCETRFYFEAAEASYAGI